MFPYQVVSEEHVKLIALHKPRSIDALKRAVDALPAAKLKKYGPELIGLVETFLKDTDPDYDQFGAYDDLILECTDPSQPSQPSQPTHHPPPHFTRPATTRASFFIPHSARALQESQRESERERERERERGRHTQ